MSLVAQPVSPETVADLEVVLAAWQEATTRLQQTHEALRAEVRRLTDELEVKNRELARKNRLADLGQMASHVAHEVRNNLVPVTLYLSLLRRKVSGDEECGRIVEKIAAGFTALDATVNDLLQFTSDRDPQWQTFPVAPLVEELFTAVGPQLAAQGIRAESDVPQRLGITADRHMLRRAVLNLVLNAVDAMPAGGRIEIRATTRGAAVELEVADTGSGLSEEILARAFEPFFTTKSGGTGLGLAIVYRVAEVHQGEVSAANRPGGGASFTLRIPQPEREDRT